MLLIADAAAVWAAVSGSWTALVVVVVCVIDGLADGIFAWRRARASFAAGSADGQPRRDARARVPAHLPRRHRHAGVVAYMVFGGLLLKPGGEAPLRARRRLRHLAVLGGGRRAWSSCAALVYWWDFVRGGEASVIPPEAVVAEPLRRLFVLQFGVLAGALLVYWAFDSSVTGLAILLVAKTAADVVLAVLERLRAARITAAVAGRRRSRAAAADGPSRAPAAAGASGAADGRWRRAAPARPRLLPQPSAVEYDIGLPRCDMRAAPDRPAPGPVA